MFLPYDIVSIQKFTVSSVSFTENCFQSRQTENLLVIFSNRDNFSTETDCAADRISWEFGNKTLDGKSWPGIASSWALMRGDGGATDWSCCSHCSERQLRRSLIPPTTGRDMEHKVWFPVHYLYSWRDSKISNEVKCHKTDIVSKSELGPVIV